MEGLVVVVVVIVVVVVVAVVVVVVVVGVVVCRGAPGQALQVLLHLLIHQLLLQQSYQRW